MNPVAAATGAPCSALLAHFNVRRTGTALAARRQGALLHRAQHVVCRGGKDRRPDIRSRCSEPAFGTIVRNRYVISKSGDILVNTVQDEAATAPIVVVVNWSLVRR